MSLDKDKKVRMFLKVGGKCEYCGRDMVLSFENHCNYENLATFDHLYNRDHDMRHREPDGERRIFIVCKKCNHDRSKTEPNNQELNTAEKTIKKIVPKERWDDHKFMERISVVVEREVELAKQIGKIDKEARRLAHEKEAIARSISKAVKYRNLLISHWNENQ